MNTDPYTIVEQRDAISHLVASGFAELLECLRDPTIYRAGRPSRRAIARRLNCSPKRAAAMLRDARAALQD